MHIETKFGLLRITSTPFADIDEQNRFSQDSDEFVRDTELGPAMFSFRFEMGEEGVDSSVYLTVTAGTPAFGEKAASTPGFRHNGLRLGYIAHIELEPARGARRIDVASRVSVHDLDNPRRILGSIIPNLEDSTLEQMVRAGVDQSVDAFLAENPGIAAQFEAACLAKAHQELDKEIKNEWEVLSNLVSLRNRCRERAARSANDALGRDNENGKGEIRAVGDSDRCAWLWAYEQNTPLDPGWDEVVATGVGMLNINVTSPRCGYIDIDLVDGRTVSISLSGNDIRLEGKVIDQSEAIAQVERAGVVLETLDLIKREGDER